MNNKCVVCKEKEGDTLIPYKGKLQWVCKSCRELLFLCNKCGNYEDEDNVCTYNYALKIYYCRKCMKDARNCKNCGVFFFDYKFKDTRGYCLTCFNEYYEICSVCDDVIRKYRAVYFPDQVMCKYCVTRNVV
jgi:hypothetical protein